MSTHILFEPFHSYQSVCRHSLPSLFFSIVMVKACPWTSVTVAEFDRIYNQSANISSTGDENQIIANFDGMVKLMRDAGEVQELHLPPWVVGISKFNRDGKAMNAGEMERKGEKICRVGFSPPLCSPDRAWLFMDDQNDRRDFKWTKHVTSLSPKFAPATDSIIGGSVGCSHLNQFLTAVHNERPTDSAYMSNKKGVIDRDRLYKADANLATAASTGLIWSCVSHKFAAKYPKLPSIFQKALNTEHNIAMGESWDQQFVQISMLASEHKSSTIDWGAIQSKIGESQSDVTRDVHDHIAFCKRYGGGHQQLLVKESMDYIALKMPAGRKVSGQWIRLLSEVPISAAFAIPRVVHAAFKAHATCAEESL
jgi:hypothetical protein